MSESDQANSWREVRRSERSKKSADLRRLTLLTALTLTAVFVIAAGIGVPATRSAECRAARHSRWPLGEPTRAIPPDQFWDARQKHAEILARCNTYEGLSVETLLHELGKPSWNSPAADSRRRDIGYYVGANWWGDSRELYFTYDVKSREIVATGMMNVD